MSTELRRLYTAMGLALVHLTAASFAFKAQVGNRDTVGARDEALKPTGVAGRLGRAQQNFPETFAVFVGAVLMLTMLRQEGPWRAFSAGAYVAGRVLFLPLCAWGVPGFGPSAGISPPWGSSSSWRKSWCDSRSTA